MVTPTTYGPMHSYTYSNVSYIDALLDASRADKWGAGGVGTGATVSYSFPDGILEQIAARGIGEVGTHDNHRTSFFASKLCCLIRAI